MSSSLTAPTVEESQLIKTSSARLRRDFEGIFGVETIERFMADSYARLLPKARIQTWVPVMAERFTRDRLRAAAKTEGKIMSDAPTVLFLCVHNAGRSQMAAGWMRHLAGDRVDVLSGGSDPASDVNPAAVEAMREVGIDIGEEFPRPWTDEIVGAADVVVTMGCGDACPVVPGKRYLDWELDDPAGKPVEAVRGVRDEIGSRVRGLLDELDVTPRS
ncbi:MAG: three-helix bundle dimerization domain-containing protein [Egibacteraceae bacterium]